MASQKVYAPFDSKLQVWMQPMFFLHPGQAERMWRELALDGQSILSKHPNDFTLFQIGEFDDATGVLTPFVPPVQFMTASAAISSGGSQPDLLRSV